MLEPTTFLVTAGKTKETGSHPDYSIQLNLLQLFTIPFNQKLFIQCQL